MLKENTHLRCMVWPRAQLQVTGKKAPPSRHSTGHGGEHSFFLSCPELRLSFCTGDMTFMVELADLGFEWSPQERKEEVGRNSPRQTPNAPETHSSNIDWAPALY